MYYHGSPQEIKTKYIQPRASKLLNGEKAVFATNTRGFALMFLAEWRDADIQLGSHKNILYAVELIPDIFEEVFDTDGYLYHLAPDDFHTDRRLGMPRHEFIADTRQRIHKKEHIPNVLAALKKEKSIKLVPYAKWIACCLGS